MRTLCTRRTTRNYEQPHGTSARSGVEVAYGGTVVDCVGTEVGYGCTELERSGTGVVYSGTEGGYSGTEVVYSSTEGGYVGTRTAEELYREEKELWANVKPLTVQYLDCLLYAARLCSTAALRYAARPSRTDVGVPEYQSTREAVLTWVYGGTREAVLTWAYGGTREAAGWSPVGHAWSVRPLCPYAYLV
eukprot:3632161-Rhodomonas_salina.2